MYDQCKNDITECMLDFAEHTKCHVKWFEQMYKWSANEKHTIGEYMYTMNFNLTHTSHVSLNIQPLAE